MEADRWSDDGIKQIYVHKHTPDHSRLCSLSGETRVSVWTGHDLSVIRLFDLSSSSFPEEEAVCVLWLSLSGICFRQLGEGCLGGALLCLHGLWNVLRPVLLQKLWPLQWVMYDVFPEFFEMSSKVNYYVTTIFSFNINIFHTVSTVWQDFLIIRCFGYLCHGPCTWASFPVCVSMKWLFLQETCKRFSCHFAC